MPPEILSCPYCNSSLTLDRPAAAGQRLRCPRCHELLPPPAGEAGAPVQRYAEPLDPGGAESAFGQRITRESPPRWSNRSVALIILSIMGVMAAIGLTFAWFTTETRRERDHSGETSAPSLLTPVISVAPAKLAALGYLPAGTNAVAGIHVAELMSRPETHSILALLIDDDRFHELTGLRLKDLDHVVLGLKTREPDHQHIFLIAQTRQPYNPERIRAALNARGTANVPGKIVNYISAERIARLGGVLWCADERTLVFGLGAKDLAAVPDKPSADLERFPEEVRKCFTDQMEKGTQAWIVSASIQWDEIMVLLQLLGVPQADQRALIQVRDFYGRLRCDAGQISGRMEIKCVDGAGAESFDKYLDSKGLITDRLVRMAQKWPRAAMLLGELAQSLQRKGKEDRLLLEFKTRTQSIEQALTRPADGDRAAD